MKQTDRHWEEFGRADPYYGVLSGAKFKKQNLTPQTLQEFFFLGETFIEDLFQQIRQQIDPSFNPSLALDFGCGVGRLVIPMARRCKQVHGVDVSPSMLKEAQSNASQQKLNNVSFFLSDDALSRIGNGYDFINSYVVLQHIPPARGMEIFQQLLSRLTDKGVFALQVPYSTPRSSLRSFLSKMRRYSTAANYVANLIEGNPGSYPHMEMNTYSLNRLCHMIQEIGVKRLCLKFESDHLFRFVTLIGQK